MGRREKVKRSAEEKREILQEGLKSLRSDMPTPVAIR